MLVDVHVVQVEKESIVNVRIASALTANVDRVVRVANLADVNAQIANVSEPEPAKCISFVFESCPLFDLAPCL